jgi:hypothetical protein
MPITKVLSSTLDRLTTVYACFAPAAQRRVLLSGGLAVFAAGLWLFLPRPDPTPMIPLHRPEGEVRAVLPKASEPNAADRLVAPQRIAPDTAYGLVAPRRFEPGLGETYEHGPSFAYAMRVLMSDMAQGRVPHGYALQPTMPASIHLPRCAASPLRVDFLRGQYLLGASSEVLVGVVSNPGKVGLDFIESWCFEPLVLAVALSPTPYLAAHGTSEIYVARFLAGADDAPVRQRPSLLGGGG